MFPLLLCVVPIGKPPGAMLVVASHADKPMLGVGELAVADMECLERIDAGQLDDEDVLGGEKD